MKQLGILALLGVLLAGCSHTATYNAAYLSALPSETTARVDGKALIYTERVDDDYVYTGKPTSYTGGATTLTVPLGKITREAAVHVYSRHFKDGADASNQLNAAGYRVVVRPRLLNFNYEYDQLKNLGFAITPGVMVEIEVKTLDAAGQTAFTKKYTSGLSQGKAYMMSSEPGERINQLIHETVFKLLDDSARDVKQTLNSPAQ